MSAHKVSLRAQHPVQATPQQGGPRRRGTAKRERRALYEYKEKNGLADGDDVRIGNHRAWLALNAEANVLRVMSYRPAKK